jgi:hypothetical protein
MWNPFQKRLPACPIDPDQQQWLDARFDWLLEQFGQDAPAKTQVVLPTPEFFPDPYEGRLEDAQAMLNRICGYMNVSPARLNLFLFESVRGSHIQDSAAPAGLYVAGRSDTYYPGDQDNRTPAQLGIERRQLADPMALAATFAHEIGHELLLGQNRVTTNEADHEPLTDLLTVFLGMGIFTANSTIRDKAWSSGTWSGWSTSSLGYLDQRMFAYALARFAHARGETNPAWARHIRPDVQAPMSQGLRYLAQR